MLSYNKAVMIMTVAPHIVDPHRNIFCFYRAPRKHVEGDFIYDQQLENNVTKSLINTLEYSNPRTALNSFLALLESKICGKNVRLRMTSGKCYFSLQSMPLVFPAVKNRILVTITNAQAGAKVSNEQPGSRPDAWIIGGNDFVIMIESKLDTSPNEKQLAGHLKRAGWSGTKYERVDLKWPEIYSCLRSCVGGVLGELDNFVIGQFLSYMEVVGMSTFEGFKNSDFDFFLVYDESGDYKPVVKKRLTDFAELVHGNLPQILRQDYPEKYTGRFTKEEFWIAFRKAPALKSTFGHCNLNLEIGPEGLFWQAVIRDGKATDNSKPIGTLYRKLQDAALFNNFKIILSGFGADFWIVVNSRTNLSRTGRPMPGADVWNEKAWLCLDSITDEGLKAVASLLIQIPYPGVVVQRKISKGDVLLTNPDLLVKQCVDSLVQLHKVLVFLEK